MTKIIISLSFVFLALTSFCQQKNYANSIKAYQQNYVKTHEVVKAKQKKYFRFFPVDKKYKLNARFEKIFDTAVTVMKTSGIKLKDFYRYGYLHFVLDNKPFRLTLYQSIALKDKKGFEEYLFLPFTDATSGEECYGGGRYIDFKLSEIINNILELDFNKAYNPYCAYTTGYNCPIPPRENDLPVAIKAGEKNFGHKH
ncbi:MAG: DUF1684 domain-containing protein [Ferruginibacter sp.]